MAISYYLKKAEETTGKSLIFLRFPYKGKNLVYSFGESINPKDWNKKKQRVKSNTQTTGDGKYLLNNFLYELSKECEKAYNAELEKGRVPEPSVLKEYLNNWINPNKEEKQEEKPFGLYDLIELFVSGEVKNQTLEKKPATLAKYKAVRDHLKRFEEKKNFRIDFDTINKDFLDKYVTYLRTPDITTRRKKPYNRKALDQNTIAKHVQIIKTFMNEAVDRELTTNMAFKKKNFIAPWKDTDAVYLNDKQIMQLFNYDLSGNMAHQMIRDAFVLACYTGLRISDLKRVKPENIITDDEGTRFISMRTEKTYEKVYIPLNPIVIRILDRYKDTPGKYPRIPSDQEFNRTLKLIAQQAGFTEQGRLVTHPERELWQCISSHTGRRSFCTNLYLEGFPIIELMKVSGHKTEKAFRNYIKVDKLDAAMKLKKHMQLTWSQKLLKVVA
jgi:integrase